MSPAAGSVVLLLLVSFTASVTGVQRFVPWTVSGVSPYNNISTPLSLDVGDVLLLGCPASSYSTAYIMTTIQQYVACDGTVGGPAPFQISYCLNTASNKTITITEYSNTVSNVFDFRRGNTFYLASFGNTSYPDLYATSGGDCLLGLKMAIYVQCGNNCSQCDTSQVPSRCLVCNPGYCLDNTTATCLPTRGANCQVCNSSNCLRCNSGYCLNDALSCVSGSANGNGGVCQCGSGSVVQNGICTAGTGGDTTSNAPSTVNMYIAIGAGAGGALVLVLCVFSVLCCYYCCFRKPKGKVMVTGVDIDVCNPESSLNALIIKQEAACVPSTMCATEAAARQYFGTLRIDERLLLDTQDKCCCEKCFVAGKNKQNKGWVLFGVSKVDASWDEAYWGVPHPDQLGEIISKGLKPHSSVTKATSSSPTQIMVTPSLKYCLYKDTFAKKQQHSDPSTGLSCSVRVVLKVRVKPKSYAVGPQSVGEKVKLDPLFDNERLEWLLEKAGNVAIESIMIKVKMDCTNSEPVTGL